MCMTFSDIHISVELRLLVILSRPILNELQVKEASALIPSIDTTRFWELLDHHRVWPCVYCNIRDHFSMVFDPDLASYLEQKYRQNVEESKNQFKAYGEILCLFKKVGVEVHTLKGIPLAKRLYCDQVKRSSRDIDLLIPHESFELAHSELRKIGFVAIKYDELSPGQQQAFFHCLKDVSYRNQDGVLLELHIRLCEHESRLSKKLTNQFLYSEKNSDAEELVYLSWHGAHSLFHRVKWILDVALYIELKLSKSENWYDDVLDIAEENDEVRSLILAMVISNILFGTILPGRVMSLYQTDRVLPLLLRMVLRTVESPERYFSIKNSFEAYLCELCLPKRYATKIGVLLKKWKPNPHDRIFFSFIPDRLYWVFVMLRPVRLLYMRTFGRSNFMNGQ